MIEDKIKTHNKQAIFQIISKDYNGNFTFDEYVKELRYDGSMDEIYLHQLSKGVTYKNQNGLVITGDTNGPVFMDKEMERMVQEKK
jgi:uncharacterized protein YbcV (DUF1398 family)